MDRIEPSEVKGGPGHNCLPAAAPDNERDDSPVVDEAVRALDAFGGRMTRTAVRQLLPMWRYYEDLNPHDMVAVLKRFPGRDTE